MYLFCLVRQAQEEPQTKCKEMEKELKLYKEREAALVAPPVLYAPPKVVPSAPPKVVAMPKVVSPAPSIPPAGLLQEDSLASSALRGEKRRRSWKKRLLTSPAKSSSRKGAGSSLCPICRATADSPSPGRPTNTSPDVSASASSTADVFWPQQTPGVLFRLRRIRMVHPSVLTGDSARQLENVS
jgi:hypothetical protein